MTSTDPNLPATRPEAALAEAHTATPMPELAAEAAPVRRPVSVAFLPLGLVVFTIVAFAIAAWTFLAAGG